MIDEDLKKLLEAMREENAAAHAETRRETGAALVGVRQENAAAHAETRRHFDVVADAMRHDIQLVAEGVAQVSSRVERRATDLDQKIDRTAADTQAMIRFSHAELDRRLRTMEENQRTLEEALSALQTRVERLESSTQ